jgi:transposase-like protein
MAMAEEFSDTPQRWTAKRRAGLVLSIVNGETSVQAAARKHGLTVAEIEEWRDRFLLAAENALRARPKDEEHSRGADQAPRRRSASSS